VSHKSESGLSPVFRPATLPINYESIFAVRDFGLTTAEAFLAKKYAKTV
jgi:hypothetical protein